MGDMMMSNLLVTSLSERAREPFQALVKTISGCSASRLNVLEYISFAYK